MLILSCQQLQKFHGAHLVLEDATFEVSHGERIGLIGRNGSGKSTLLQIITGDLRPDGGQFSLQKGTRIGYLPQVPLAFEEQTVYEVLSRGYKTVLACRQRMTELEARMAAFGSAPDPRALDALLRQYADEQARFEHEGGYEMEAQVQQVADGIQIPPTQFTRAYASLSGGEKARVGLAALLLERPNLLLLDEPTNHLDMAGIEWLEGFLSTYEGACLIVSHDRYFLDRVVTKVVELEDGETQIYHTHYTGYLKDREERLLQQFADFQEQRKKIKQMQETIRQLKEWGKIGGNNKFFRRAASMQKALDRMEKLKRPVMERKNAEFALRQADRSGKEVVLIEGLSKSYGARELLRQVESFLVYGEKVAIVGPNGAGKSTLFRLLLGQEIPDAGEIRLGARVEIGYLAQQERPQSEKSVLQTFCEEAKVEEGAARAMLARYLFYGADVFKPVHLLSGGEWTRLRLALLVHRQPNLLLLDEPTNHLDIPSREALEEALEEFPGTVLAISHDRYFINRIAERVWELADGQLSSYLGHYDDYREKRAKRQAPAPVSTPTKRQPQGPPPPKPSRQAATAQRQRAQLEQAIADLEGKLADLNRRAAEAHAANDLTGLASCWAERERLQAELEQRYADWMRTEP